MRFLLLLALCGYLLPWSLDASAALTFNAYDLAEWASLHPSQRGGNPTLLLPLLLRLQVPLLGIALALLARKRQVRRWTALAVAILALAQLPPPEFLLDLANVNYRQQFFLALGSLAFAGLAMWMPSSRLRASLLLILPALGVALALLAMQQAQAMPPPWHPISRGAGVWILCASYIVFMLLVLIPPWRTRRLP